LRAAIIGVNLSLFAGPHTIKFDIGFGVQTIVANSPLPVIQRPVLIDGTSQEDRPSLFLPLSCSVRRGHPCIELRGYGLTLAGGGSTVQGLAINSADSDAAITLTERGNNVVRGNYIGTDVTGTIARPNEYGVLVLSDENRIGGTTPSDRNVIAASHNNNVSISGTGNVVQGNFVGTNAAGTSVLADHGTGVAVGGSGNVVGGTAVGAGNLVSGHYYGVYLGDEGGHLVQGNFIGTDVTGRLALGNETGIFVCSSPNNVIGGPSAAARNVISGNRGPAHLNGGIYIYNGADGTRIEGNFIGTDVTGKNPLGNEPQGIYLLDVGGSVRIGGAAFGAGNVISGNIGPGVRIYDAVGATTVLHGNFIGTKSNGLYPLGNLGDGVLIEYASSHSSVGGLTDGSGNRIGFNGGAGVRVQAGVAGPSILNPILGNAIFGNAGLGIDLGPAGVTPNDDGDADTGDNELQNHPILGAAFPSSHTSLTVQGTLNSTPNTTFRIEFFANTLCDPSGYGQAERYLGATYAATNASGNASFEAILAAEVPVGNLVAATATDVEFVLWVSGQKTIVPNNTSELGPCVVVAPAP
jgi:titin